MQQREISAKIARKCEKSIIAATSTLAQVLKQFDGIYGTKLPECDGMTVEEFMSFRGVERIVTKTGKKKGYAPAAIFGTWDSRLKREDRAAILKEYGATYVMSAEQCEELGVEHGEDMPCVFQVYNAENTTRAKSSRRAIKRYLLRVVDDNKWSVATILKGLRQTANAEKEILRNNKLEDEWENYDKVYIVYTRKGEQEENVMEVSKDSVTF